LTLKNNTNQLHGVKTLKNSKSHAARQELQDFLQNWKVHYGVNKSSPSVPVLNQMNSVHGLKSYFEPWAWYSNSEYATSLWHEFVSPISQSTS
jgi:hypothetical protein